MVAADPNVVPPAARSPWAPLRHPVFLALFTAQLASNIGTLMQSVGSAWYMGDLGASAGVVALVQTATFLPALLVGIPAGALADIVDRRRLLIATQAWMMVMAFLLAALAFADAVTPGLLLALTFAIGLGAALNGPAWQAIQPDLVPREDIGQAIALGALTYNVGRAIGPAVGGLIVAGAGPAWVFLLNACSFVGILVVLGRWRSAPRESRLPVETLAAATRSAVRYGVHAPVLRAVLIRTVLYIVPAATLQALMPSVVREGLGQGSGRYGLLLTFFGAGAACSALARPRIETHLSIDRMHGAATAVTVVALVVQGTVRNYPVLTVMLFVAGFAWTLAMTTTAISAQMALPGWVRARGLGLYVLAVTGGVALGAAVAGALAEWSLTGAHLVAAAALAAGLAIARRWRLRAAHQLDQTPVPLDPPDVRLAPGLDDGPILVAVRYRVPVGEAPGFVRSMGAVERHRRRTGAYRWELHRDLAAPELFVESFCVRTWGEHLRQHDRHTLATEPVMAVVRPYLVAAEPPVHLIAAQATLRQSAPTAAQPVAPLG